MATTKAFNGFQPSRMRGGAYNTSGMNEYGIKTAHATDIFQGDLVKIVSGKVHKVSAATDLVAGVFMGANWVDPSTKQPTFSNYFPGTQVHHGAGEPKALVLDDPDATYIIQAGATVADAQMGKNMDVSLGAGSTVTGMSGFSLKGGAGSVQAKTVRLLRRSTLPSEAATDEFPKIEVKVQLHRDHYGMGSVVSIT
tara:strand:- start:3789 stop:4376 length:588 start_codon:yes stop_codon:yes gene_type:complete